MSKRIIFNSNEIATHEDVQNAQDRVSGDLGRVLEGLSLGVFGSAPAAGTEGLAIVAGLGVSGSSSNLSVTVGTGSAVFSFSDIDPTQRSSYILGELESSVVLTPTLTPTIGGTERWYLVEVSATKVVSNESRSVKSPTGFTPTSVPKVETTSLTARIRPGVEGVVGAGTLPPLQVSPEWLPLAAFLINAGDLNLASAKILDLRKMLSHFVPPGTSSEPYGEDGFSRPVSFQVLDDLLTVSVSRNVVSVGGYSGPLSTSPTTASPLSFSALAPRLTLDDDSPGISLAGSWKYIYAYRPSSSCGYVTLCLSAVPPVSSLVVSAIQDGLHPTSSFTPPAPFNLSDSVLSNLALCLGAVVPYSDTVSGDTRLRLSGKAGGFTRQTYREPVVSGGDVTGGEVIVPSTSLAPSVSFDPLSLVASPVRQPASSVGVRLLIRIRASSVPVPGISYFFWVADTSNASVDSSALFATSLFPGDISEFSLDVFSSTILTVSTNSPELDNLLDVRAVGFYEAY